MNVECSNTSTIRSCATCDTVFRISNTCAFRNPSPLESHADFRRYIVVDLMNGGDLRFHISRKCFTEDAIRFWIAELGCALKYIHSQGIIHRDVKPDNVLLDSEGHVHLADFVCDCISWWKGSQLTFLERRIGFQTRQASDKQVGHAGIPCSGSV